jgi:hypothetical protein
MKNIEESEQEMLPEYHFDYSKAKPNRFASKQAEITVTLAPDVAAVFKNSEAVNAALRAMLKFAAQTADLTKHTDSAAA